VVAVLKTVDIWIVFDNKAANVVHFVLTEVVILVVVSRVVIGGPTVDVFTVVVSTDVVATIAPLFIGMFGQVAVGVHGDEGAMHWA
jgi:hypothetical protein